jgi:hypothetical protein
MAIEQMNISLSPQAEETAKRDRAVLAGFEAHLPQAERDDIRRSVQRGIKDIEAGRFEEHDADGLRGLGKKLVAQSVKKHAARTKSRMTPLLQSRTAS